LIDLSRKQGTQGYDDLPEVDDLKLFEFEMGTGVNFSRGPEGMRTRPGANLFFELRLNRPEPWDVALQLGAAKFTGVATGSPDVRTTIFSPSLFVDYNHRFNRRTMVFAGVGLGGAFADNRAFDLFSQSAGRMFSDNAGAFAVTPRVGVSFLNFLRLTASYSITARDYSRFSLNVGITVGGSYKSPWIDRRSKKQKFWEDTAPAVINILTP
jgi:opacity protein-like surface antigen